MNGAAQRVGRRWVGAVWLAVAACGGGAASTETTMLPEVSFSPPQGEGCRSIGMVTGRGGGAFGGWTSNDRLIQAALDDLAENAAAMGATHVHATAPSLGDTSGTTTTATVVGTAFMCTSTFARSRADIADAALRSAAARARSCLRGAGPLVVEVFFDTSGTVIEIGELPDDDGQNRSCLAQALVRTRIGTGSSIRVRFDFRAGTTPPPARPSRPDAGPAASSGAASTAPASLTPEVEREIGDLIAARRDAVLACAGVNVVGIRVEVGAEGSVSVSAQGALANTPEARCIADLFTGARVSGTTPGTIVRVVQ